MDIYTGEDRHARARPTLKQRITALGKIVKGAILYVPRRLAWELWGRKRTMRRMQELAGLRRRELPQLPKRETVYIPITPDSLRDHDDSGVN